MEAQQLDRLVAAYFGVSFKRQQDILAVRPQQMELIELTQERRPARR